MAYKFVQLYDKNSVPTFPVKGPSCGGIFDQEDSAAYWYKFATIKLTTQYVDMVVLFHITKSYNNFADGTLLVHVRQNGSPAIALSGILMEWISMSQNIRPKNYAYVSTTGQVDLYYKRTGRWEDFHIEILKGDSRNNSNYSLGGNVTLHSHNNATGVTSLSGTVGYSYCGFYKVGDIICTTSATDPSTYYGGTWAKIQDRFLIGAGNSYGAGGTGGGTSVTLSTSHMPSHSHGMPAHNHWFELTSGGGGWHTHGVYSHNGNTGSWEFLRPSGWTGGNGWRQVDATAEHTHWIAGWTGNNNGAGSTNAAGSGSAFSIMPPWYGVYFWRRTA